MKRKLIVLLSVVLAFSILLLPALAHSGRTDSNGGHYNRTTGEYHYHHGYPAHQHDPYCPYQNKDNTSTNSTSNKNTTGSTKPAGTTNSTGSTVKPSTSSNNKNQYVPQNEYQRGYLDGYKKGLAQGDDKKYDSGLQEGIEIGFDSGFSQGKSEGMQETEALLAEERTSGMTSTAVSVFATCGFFAFVIWYLLYRENKPEKKIQTYKSKDNLPETYRDQLSKLLSAQKCQLDLPKDVYLSLNATPIKGRASFDRPFGDFTCYMAPNQLEYHKKFGCCNAESPVHLFKISSNVRPCKICIGNLSGEGLPKWYIQLQEQLKNIIGFGYSIPSPGSKVQRPAKKQFSSFISSYWYQDGTLYVKMKNGTVYSYFNVPQSVYDEMLSSESIGAFFNANVSRAFEFESFD